MLSFCTVATYIHPVRTNDSEFVNTTIIVPVECCNERALRTLEFSVAPTVSSAALKLATLLLRVRSENRRTLISKCSILLKTGTQSMCGSSEVVLPGTRVHDFCGLTT